MTSNFRWFGRDVQRRVDEAASRALFEAGHVILEDANQHVPELYGFLKESGAVDPPTAAAVRNEVTVSYDTPYAVRQHEDTRLRHAPGREAKWLERSMNRLAGRVGEMLTEAIRRAH